MQGSSLSLSMSIYLPPSHTHSLQHKVADTAYGDLKLLYQCTVKSIFRGIYPALSHPLEAHF